jgi:hypothetical protein
MDAQHLELADDFLHRKRTGRGLGVENDFAAVAVDQLARIVGRLIGLALRVAGNDLDLASAQAPGCVELVHLGHHGVARRDAELCHAPGQDGGHADADRFVLCAGNERESDSGGRGHGTRGLDESAAILRRFLRIEHGLLQTFGWACDSSVRSL